MLLDGGAQLDARMSSGFTPVYVAAQRKSEVCLLFVCVLCVLCVLERCSREYVLLLLQPLFLPTATTSITCSAA